MTMTMTESAARHMAAGVMDLDELARLVGIDIGKAPSREALRSYRTRFRRYGEGWIEAFRLITNDASKRWNANNRGKSREKAQRWKAENPSRRLLNACRANARQRGQECTITAEMIDTMLEPMTCSATGLSLRWEHDGSARANPWAPSIDRIHCSKGYVPGNVRVVCWAFNQMRGDFPDEVVTTLAKALAARAP